MDLFFYVLNYCFEWRHIQNCLQCRRSSLFQNGSPNFLKLFCEIVKVAELFTTTGVLTFWLFRCSVTSATIDFSRKKIQDVFKHLFTQFDTTTSASENEKICIFRVGAYQTRA